MRRKLFCGTLLAEGGNHFVLLYARLRVAALIENLLFGAINHLNGMTNLACFLVR